MASQNKDIKMRIFLEAGAATKAYNALMNIINSNNAKMAELEKAGKRGTDEYKTIKQETQVVKKLVKETQTSYEDLAVAVKTVNSKMISELEMYIKDAQKKIRQLNPNDKALFAELTNQLGVFQRELAARQQQIREGAMRSYKEVLRDINTSQEHLQQMSKQAQDVAVAKEREAKALQAVSRTQNGYEAAQKRYATWSKAQLDTTTEMNALRKKLHSDTVFDIDVLIKKQTELLKLQNATPAQRNKADYGTKLAAADVAYAEALSNVQKTVAAHNEDAVVVSHLIEKGKEYAAIMSKPVKEPNEATSKALIKRKQAEYEAQKKVREEAEKTFDEIQKKAGNDQPFQHSIETLKRLRDEYKALRDTEMDAATRNEMTLKLVEMDRAITNMETHMMSGKDVSKLYWASIAEIEKGTSANSAKLRENIEMMKIAQKSQEIDAEMHAKLANAIKVSNDMLNQEGHTYLTSKQAEDEYQKAKKLTYEGDKANADAVRLSIAAMTQAQHVKGIDIATTAKYAEIVKELNTLLTTQSKKYIDIYSANAIYLNGINNTVGDIQNAIDAYKNMAKEETTMASEAALYNTRAKELTDILTKQAKASVSAGDATTYIKDAMKLLQEPLTKDASDLRIMIDIMKKIQDSTGISVKTTQEAARIEKQLSDVLKGKEKTFMSLAQAQTKYTEAENLVVQADKANAAAVKEMIDAMREAQVAEGVNIATSNQYYLMEQKLTDMLKVRTKAVMNATQADAVYEKSKALLRQGNNADAYAVKTAIDEMEKAVNAQGASITTSHLYRKTLESLRELLKGTSQEAAKTHKSLGDVAYDFGFVDKTMRNLKSAPIKDLELAIKMVEKRMKELSRSDDEYTKHAANYKKLKAEMDAVNKSLGKQKEQVDKTNGSFKRQSDFIGAAAKKLFNYLGIFGGFYLVRQQMQKAFEANIKYDEAMTNIRKTTQLTSDATYQLGENIKRIKTRTSLEDMNDLAYAAGRLGVKGADNILGFVRAANQINVALGEQLKGKESVEQLMKITNLMGINDKYGLEQALLKTGSAINLLTMESTATAQPMVDFMRRTSGISKQAGVSTAELVGLSGAINALGQNVEMSATSISKMFVQITSKSDKVISALKMSAEEAERFKLDIGSGNMMDAFLTVLRKTNEAGGLSHLGTIVKDLGSEGQRVVQTISTLAANYSTVETMVRKATDAFEKGTSATDEYNIKNQNTAALWEKLKNEFAKLFVSEEMTGFFHDIMVNLQQLPYAVKNFASSFSWVIAGLEKLVKLFTEATWAFELFANVLVVKAITRTITNWGLALYDFIKKLKKAKAAGEALNTVIKANIIVAAISLIVGAFVTWYNHVDKAKEAMRSLAEDLQRAKDQYQSTAKAIKDFDDKQRELGENTVERSALLQDINNKYGDYIDGLIKEGEGYDVVSQKLQAVNEQLRMKALLTAKADSETRIRDEYSGQRGAAMGDLVNAIMQEMSNPDRETARNIAQSMIDNIDNILVSEKDASDNVLKYGQFIGSDLIREGGRNAIGSRNLYSAFGGTAVKSQLFSTANGVGFMEGGNVDDIVKALVKYGNVDAGMNTALRSSYEMYQADIQRSARKANETYAPQASKQFADVASMVKLTGKSDKTGSLELEAGVVRDDKGNIVGRTGLAEQRHTDEWTRMKQGMDNDTRNANIKELDEYIKVQRQNVLDLKNMGKDKEEEYNKESVYLSNAERLREILSLGKLETKEDKTKDKNPGKDEYQDLIAKIEAFYNIREQELKRQYLSGEMTETQYGTAVDDNTQMRHYTLRTARRRVLGRAEGEEWNSAVNYDLNDQMLAGMGEEGMKALERIIAVGDPKKIGDHLRKMATYKGTEEGEASSAMLSEIGNASEKDFNSVLEINKKRFDEAYQIWMQRNPLGQLSDQFEKDLTKLGLLLTDYSNRGGRTIAEMQQDVMAAYLEIGKSAFNFDINSQERFEAFKEKLASFPDFADKVATATAEDIKDIYYKSYEYAEQYAETASKLADKNIKIWNKMYEKSASHLDLERQMAAMERLKSTASDFEGFGLSSRLQLDDDVRAKSLKYADARMKYDAASDKANSRKKAAESLTVGSTSEDGTIITQKYKDDQIAMADAELEALKSQAEVVVELFGDVVDAQMAVREANAAWVGEMEQSFETFMDSFVPFRSWYEDNGSMAENIFGTKEERQEAFASFMDDIKKTTKKAIVERVRLSISRKVQDKMDLMSQKMSEKAALIAHKLNKKEEVITDQVANVQEQIADTQTTQIENANSEAGKNKTIADKTTETSGTVLANMAQAASKAFAQLGPIAGAVAAGVVSAAIGALLTMAMNALGKRGKGDSASASTTSTKLVSGMLTYDRGNVQSFGVRTYDGGLMPVMGDNGKVYMAAQVGQLGTGMVMQPTLTSIGGAPALVGEEGPEMVIGRETTHALQMNRPDIMRIIMEYDKNRSHGRVKTYDSGNVSAAAGAGAMGMGGSDMAATMAALAQTLDNIQRNGIAAKINKYGRGGLVDEVASGVEQVNRVGAMGNVRRVFGK